MQKKSLLSAQQLAVGSVLIAVVVLALKYAAYAMTNSVGLYSDALETLINLAAAFAVLVALRLGEKPADHNHQFGHHKAEYLSAVAEGVLVVLAAITIFMEALDVFQAPRDLSVPIIGLVLNGLAGVINAVWAYALVHIGRQLRSPALVADGRHLFTDVVTSIGVLAGVGLAKLTGLNWLDPLLAMFVGVSILWTGWQLIRGSLSGLMDEAIDQEELQQLRQTIMDNADGAIEAHDIRTRHAGRVIFVEFHLVVPSKMTVYAAHAICDRIENALKQEMPHAVVTIHVEPEYMANESVFDDILPI
ncbi:cation diffusion facilitator family transporter [Cohaesibacter haloalkalitolerans]|uniref:cation diffusion facilitator family transporter n=1 Tax=Cohaesibacter haloalkalitolerans TaxID=1162980 RepID=UPI000E65AF52|nr:cation diffusion facilitator family transporter [Cohaesibacter haloalkalitolerans]